ncbi:hypothetical protein F5Y04DRAFT_147212 [Hypomontagnella monticulosa]|nr:hypothetical protein F5Y04DRAFT_147212 [Hypomontagnella monticulosa]
MTDTGMLQNIRLRTACDPCSEAKVRCDKKHPICDRCLLIKRPCSYSESRKHGKQSWRRRLAREQTKMATGVEAGVQSLTPLIASPSVPVAGSQASESLLNFGQYGSLDAAILSSWPSGDSFSADIDIGDFATWDVADLPSPKEDCIPTQRPSFRDNNPRISGPVKDQTPTSTINTHDCEAQAISILSSMQHGEVHRGLTSCSTDPIYGYANLDLTPGFDRVLAINKAALHGWSKLMRCSCAQCPHLILLYVSILSKMLFWYRIAAEEKLPLPGDAGNDARNSDGTNTDSSQGEAPSIDRFRVRPTTIQVGTFGLDAEDQAHLRRIVLLRELRRTEKAIDELMNVDRTDTEEYADDIVRRNVQWSLSGVSRLREELQDVIQRVKQIR